MAIRTPPTIDPVTGWAKRVVSGKVLACRYVKLACERHLRDLDNRKETGFIWSPNSARYARAFFERFLVHTTGEWGGQPFILEEWQVFVIGSVWGWKKADGTRRFRTVWEEIPRKNGKSQKLAGVGLLGLVADNEPGANIFAAATKKDQARIVYGEAYKIVGMSPELNDHVRRFRNNLSVDSTGSKFEPLSSDERTLDGLNPHIILLDEIHKHKNRALLDVLDTAIGARRQPLLWQITTAGDDNPESVYHHENDYAIKVLEQLVVDESLFVFITTIDQGDDWADPVAWQKANPNYGVSVKHEDLERQANKAKNSPAALAAFKRLRLNVRTSDASQFIQMETWHANSDGPIDPKILLGRPCYGAVDLSSKIDLSAYVLLFPPDRRDRDGKFHVLADFWAPADTVQEKSDRDRVQYQRWVDNGYLRLTSGNVIDHDEIEAHIRDTRKLYRIQSLAYDPWNSTQMAIKLQGTGLKTLEFVQGIRSYTAPTKELEALLLRRRLDHGKNPLLAWMANNLHVQRDKNENMMPTKKHSNGRIDGMTALIMTIGQHLAAEVRRSPYEERGPRVA